MKNIKAWRHGNWGKIQLAYFKAKHKIIREKNIEDYILNNDVKCVHFIKDNTVFDDFIVENDIDVVDPAQAELVVITSQQFSRLDVKVMLSMLDHLLDDCPRIYLALNRYYLNANESFIDPTLPDHYDSAITRWLENSLQDTVAFNISENFKEDGAHFTWVVPSCEVLLCRK